MPLKAQPSNGVGERLHRARLRAFLGAGREELESSDLPDSIEKGPVDELTALLERTANLYAASVTEHTRAAYARRWRLFERWCQEHDLGSLPAEAETVMLYLAAATKEGGFALSTLRGWMAAINRVHLEAGFPSPGQHPAMGMFLRGLSRQVPRPPARPQISALRIDGLRTVCKALEAETTDFRTLRDRALLCMHALGLGDGEISRLLWADIHLRQRSILVEVRGAGSGRPTRQITADVRQPVGESALAALAALRRYTDGPALNDSRPVFTPTPTSSRTGSEPLTPKGVFQVRKTRLEALSPGPEKAKTEVAIRLLEGPPSVVLRDRAMILIGFAGAFRRNELTGLMWTDIAVSADGAILTLRRSKTDLAGRGCVVGIPRGRNELTCPVAALERWRERCILQLSGGLVDTSRNSDPDAETPDDSCAIDEWPVFCALSRTGRMDRRALSPEGLTMMIQLRANQAGITGRWGGRSLRSGFISTAADLDIPLEAIARQSRHATLDTLAVYIRDDNPFRRNPAARVGL
ncbi:tyrosine-type recombinase/integrase [Nocardioides sp. LS1]|uniref:tyrosine-type recombinase/integrase n=1 Tax=Nocardioides sp. LS1 TaxID=1027620 RepID=UPI000F6173B9|nr:tyrosine-type recombinase/integrase [Nocardioides sp. LS1]GCD90169.1 hypothetical protein NLS1_21750 [Nocardioides sp. LS1]